MNRYKWAGKKKANFFYSVFWPHHLIQWSGKKKKNLKKACASCWTLYTGLSKAHDLVAKGFK